MPRVRLVAVAAACMVVAGVLGGCGGGSEATQATQASLSAGGGQPATSSEPRFDNDDHARLQAQARQQGAAHVTVALAHGVNLFAAPEARAGQQALAAQDWQTVLNELGAEAWPTGRVNTGLGFAHLHVTSAGLEILARSPHVKRVSPAVPDGTVFDGDGSQAAIEAALAREGQAVVDVLLNLEALDFRLAADGSTRFIASAQQDAELAARWPAFVASLDARHVRALDTVAMPSPGEAPIVRLTLTREGYVQLRAHRDVRALKPAGFTDARPLQLDLAGGDGPGADDRGVEVVLSLREGLAYTTGRHLSAQQEQRQARAYQQAWREMLGPLVPASALPVASVLPSAVVRLPADALQRLIGAPDARLLSLQANRALGTVGAAAALQHPR